MAGAAGTARLALAFADRQLWNIRACPASVRLDAGELDHLGPLLGLVDNQLAEVGGRTDERCATQIGEPRLDLMIGETGVDLLVDLLDDLGRRGLRCADAG